MPQGVRCGHHGNGIALLAIKTRNAAPSFICNDNRQQRVGTRDNGIHVIVVRSISPEEEAYRRRPVPSRVSVLSPTSLITPSSSQVPASHTANAARRPLLAKKKTPPHLTVPVAVVCIYIRHVHFSQSRISILVDTSTISPIPNCSAIEVNDFYRFLYPYNYCTLK